MTKLPRLLLLSALFALGLAYLSSQPSRAPAEDKVPALAVTKWEYKTAKVPVPGNEPDKIIEKALNNLGADGWELVCETADAAGWKTFILKRPKR